jgi:hypothetical protein
MPEKPFAFLLGAGASVSTRHECHIKSATDMVVDWISRIYKDQVGQGDREAALQWASKDNLGIDTYDSADPAASYSKVYSKAFEHDKECGYAYIQQEIDGKSPDLGYYLLAQIVSSSPTKLVVTTNFDNNALDALSSISPQYPLIVGHEALAGYVQDRPTRPTVIKLHRDLFYAPKSDATETSKMDLGLADLVSRLCGSHPFIVVGYGGNDDSLMDVLNDLPTDAFPGGLFWCWYTGGVKPSQRIVDLVLKTERLDCAHRWLQRTHGSFIQRDEGRQPI